MSQSKQGEFKPVEKGQEQNLPGYVEFSRSFRCPLLT